MFSGLRSPENWENILLIINKSQCVQTGYNLATQQDNNIH